MVGLVIDSAARTVIVADPNGALQVGSNMEFLSMPLTKLEIKATTSVSRYDREMQEKKLQDMNARRNACAQAKAQAKEKKAKWIREIEAKKLEEANAMRNACAQAKAQAKEMKAKRIRDTTGEGEEDQNTNAKKTRIDEN